ncbi:hypothetical protein C6P44_005138 [Monosporozyma unispora]|nr:hypothetical protein C6P44_005138 [Kazachstania unispora]
MKLQLKFANNLKYFPRIKLPVTDSTLPVDNRTLPKGLHGPILRYANVNRLYSNDSFFYSSPHFKMRYYPPNHFLCLFRKTKPSITVQTTQMASFIDECKSTQISDYLKKVYVSKKSIVPGDFAVWRRKITVEVKTTFIKEWFKLGGDNPVGEKDVNTKETGSKSMLKELSKQYEKKEEGPTAKDGYYVFFVYKYPSKSELRIFREDIGKAVKAVAEGKPQVKYKKFDKNWVDRVNNKLNINSINRILSISDCPYKLIKTK